MNRKVFRIVLLALLALSLMTSVAYAHTQKYVEVSMFKHGSIPDDVDVHEDLENYVYYAMAQIKDAVWEASEETVELVVLYNELEDHTDWSDDNTCSMYPNSTTGFSIYFVQDRIASSWADRDGGYAVVDIDHKSTCYGYFDTGPLPTTVHELGHVFGARDRHGTAGKDVMDKYDAQDNYDKFDTASKYKIAQFVGCVDRGTSFDGEMFIGNCVKVSTTVDNEVVKIFVTLTAIGDSGSTALFYVDYDSGAEETLINEGASETFDNNMKIHVSDVRSSKVEVQIGYDNGSPSCSGVYGDIDDSGSITEYDEQLAAEHLAELITLDECEQEKADLNDNGRVDIGDVSCIASHIAHGTQCGRIGQSFP